MNRPGQLSHCLVSITRRAILLALAISGLAACASLPEVDPDTACTIPTRDDAEALDVLRTRGEAIAGTRFVAGNLVTLLVDGPRTYAAMRRLIGGAKHRIDMESYEFDGGVAQEFAALLTRKRLQGVTVNLIYDSWGSMDTPDTVFAGLRKGGVNVVDYSPFDPTELSSLDVNRRDHRKLLVVDGAVAITGGVNISQVYKNRRHRHATGGTPGDDPDILPWRDTDIRIEGPAVAEFETLFMESWRAQHGPPIADPPPPPPGTPGDSPVQAIDGTPVTGHPAIYRTMLLAIAVARHSVHLTTGFFVPTPDLAEGLECAARRGVDVRIVVPGLSTSSLSVAAGRAHYTGLLKAGVKIYERQKMVLHAKTAVIDGDWSTIGSANLDWRSVVFNNEMNAVILGPAFGGQMEALFRRDLAGSKPIDLDQWHHRPMAEKMKELGARLGEFLL